MKNTLILSWMALSILFAGIIVSPATAQDSTAVANDTADIMPFPTLPIISKKATGNKKTGELVITVEFQSTHDRWADVSLSFAGWVDFGFTTDKGGKYTVHLGYNRLMQDNPNKPYKSVENIQFGDKKMWVGTVVPQEFQPGDKRTLTIRVPGFNKTAKEIQEFRVKVIYSPSIIMGGTKKYVIRRIPIEWK